MELSNFNINFNNRILRILIIALLIFCMVFGGFMIQYCHAELVISTSIIVAATFLVACGVIAQSDVDLYAIAQDFMTFLGPLAVVLNQNYKWVSGATFHITNALMEKLAEYISLRFSADVNGTPVGTIRTPAGAFDITPYVYNGSIDYYTYNQGTIIDKNFPLLDLVIPASNGSVSSIIIKQGDNGFYTFYKSNYYYENIPLSEFSPFNPAPVSNINFLIATNPKYPEECYFVFPILGTSFTVLKSALSNLTGVGSPGVTAKANSTYFPQTGKKALTTSVPLTYPESMTGLVTGGINGVRSDLADVGTDVGVISGTLSGLWETVKGIGTTISTGITSIVGAIAGFFDVSEFSLDLNPLKIGLTKVFPFCIPFDMLRGIKTLASNPTAFVYDIKLDTKFFDINHTVNLAPYRVPILFFRYIVDFWFIWILISRTRDLMKW